MGSPCASVCDAALASSFLAAESISGGQDETMLVDVAARIEEITQKQLYEEFKGDIEGGSSEEALVAAPTSISCGHVITVNGMSAEEATHANNTVPV